MNVPIEELAAITDDGEGGMMYKHSDMMLRIAAKELMVESDQGLMPHRRATVERGISHIVFELAYRTHTVQEYIELHKMAVDLGGEAA